MAHDVCDFTSAYTYDELPLLPEEHGDIYVGEVKDHECAQVIHTGPYKHLGNAWSAAMGYQRSHHMKENKRESNENS